MIKKFALLLCFFGIGSFVSLRAEDMAKCWAMLPDSILSYEKVQELFNEALKLQKQSCEMFEKSKELMEKLKNLKVMDDVIEEGIRKRYDFPKFGLLYTEGFDDTGLIRGKVKYFIRIWKHPPKEKFKMPTFKFK
ncbi:hypothetical protein JGI7_00576 [Candidatus Kryptonium thompsonii]|jgi:hypothetical protein|uniref:Uncharacterized protein n=2 Tax=Candidatus Kryptonium thompsonii TaxID=1633631 RepID=A0A0P1MYG3_9BACT|nr:hypothetical protein [Candidatus Kryptonium thompsoni]CUS82146.1 hypothetical protein JGI7_00576 [Candidatus Kryptonium thompsoni]CUS84173.1 hypothetical protein JGI14_10174 [Candidatus Kryptonium thompsoni]CUS84525.1 hypothetical protein JGI10_01025 [Candidatus Kryptonium thompsoni]CUS84921.1 hypothetical protein JGI8_00853 [Candidatus Kryptonium thompsoni]CUS85815.1 hypothetical protein JGI13_01238 [Candidatus Kryptonium thompsoni]